MARKSKVFDSFAAAVADIPNGSSIAFGGFAYPGVPFNLIRALLDQGATGLTLITNGTGGSAPDRMPDIGMLVENGQAAKVVASFTAPTRASDRIPLTKYVAEGKVVAELVPQGTLAERLRAAGAGIPAFYTPTAVGTELAAGRETRVFGGREYLLEEALPVDYAFIRAWKADTAGNLLFRRSQRNFNPLMATAAKCTIVEVEEDFLAPGEIDPDQVHTASIFVHRMVRIPQAPEGLWPGRRAERVAARPEQASAKEKQA
jgi:3-oxoacid CoA-transferase A subunit